MSRRDRRPHHTGKPLPAKPKLPVGKAPGELPSSLELLKAAMAAEDWPLALRIASRMSSLGSEKEAIVGAWEALKRPEFQRSIGKDPEAAIEAGKAALRRRFGT